MLVNKMVERKYKVTKCCKIVLLTAITSVFTKNTKHFTRKSSYAARKTRIPLSEKNKKAIISNIILKKQRLNVLCTKSKKLFPIDDKTVA